MIKRIPRDLNIFTMKNKRCDVSLPIPCIRPSLSRGHQTVKQCLNVYTIVQNARGASRHPPLMVDCPTCNPMS